MSNLSNRAEGLARARLRWALAAAALAALGGLLAVIAFGSGSALGQSTPAKPVYGVGATAPSTQTFYWKDPGDSSITHWQVRQKLVDLNTQSEDSAPWGAWSTISGSSATTTTHSITGLADGYHCFELRAVNGNGNGTTSNRVCEYVVAAKTTTLSASDVTEGNSGTKDVMVTVNLTAPAPSGGLRVRVTFNTSLSEATIKYNCSGLNPATHDICYTSVADSDDGVLVPQGQQTATATFKVVGDTRDEGDELVLFDTPRYSGGT